MIVRRGTPLDATLLAKHRAAVWLEVGGWSVADLAPQVPVWTEFFRRHTADETYVAFIAEEGESVIGSGGLLVHLAMPHPHLVSDRAGRVHSVFVEAAARRKGVARAILERLLGYAREALLVSLSLHPSEEGRNLYTSFGFQNADEMLLRLTQTP